MVPVLHIPECERLPVCPFIILPLSIRSRSLPLCPFGSKLSSHEHFQTLVDLHPCIDLDGSRGHFDFRKRSCSGSWRRWNSTAPLFARAFSDTRRVADHGLFSGQDRNFRCGPHSVIAFRDGLAQKRLLVHTPLGPGQQYAVARVLSYLIFLFGLIVGLQSLGVNLNSLVVIGGALGIGVGLGLQAIVSNFVAGLILLIEAPIKLGDRIQVGSTYGDVVRLRGRCTWVRTNENVVIIVPNSEFINQSVTNWTANDRQVRISISVGVSYESDPPTVRDLMLTIARSHPDVLADPQPEVIFTEFGDSSLDFELRIWTVKQVQTPARLKSDLYFSIFEAFRREKIELPFPQRDLHIRSVSDPISSAALALTETARPQRAAGSASSVQDDK